VSGSHITEDSVNGGFLPVKRSQLSEVREFSHFLLAAVDL